MDSKPTITVCEESEGEVAARSVSKVKIDTNSDTDNEVIPSRKKRRRRNVKRDIANMEIDSNKNSKSGSTFLKPVEASSSGTMEWESDPEMNSDDSWSYIDADDEQSDFPDACVERGPKPDGTPTRKNRGIHPSVQRKIERFYYSNQRELLLSQISQLHPIERFIRNKKMSIIKRGRGVILIRKQV